MTSMARRGCWQTCAHNHTHPASRPHLFNPSGPPQATKRPFQPNPLSPHPSHTSRSSASLIREPGSRMRWA
ncbi:hypothetical protein FIBSPDRAFT_362539 [Athelia psychrophila]|uniref:Uncharacterized protein n=1 Tax=Athelia psychrophila TaxID=1759441 RepID=A0A166PDI2_9AGAM|nr:hypothetical protein FIBSPDRAFT_362539 [Fibularhizoctonia sp. CBS 109695]